MAKHRPTDSLRALVQQALASCPEGLAPRDILDYLIKHDEDISRPTLNRLLAQGTEQKLWVSHGHGRSVTYTLGQSKPVTPSQESDPMSTSSPAPDAGSPAARGKKAKVPVVQTATSLHDQIRAVVWEVADTLRDKTSLQVEAYQPVTLALMGLKRNLDIQTDLLRSNRPLGKAMASQMAFIDDAAAAKVMAASLNNGKEVRTGFWNRKAVESEKFGLPLMSWADFANFPDSPKSGPRDEPYVMILDINPSGHKTPETALFTYTTTAPDIKALLLELVESMVPDLSEAFGAVGAHGVLNAQSEHVAVLSNQVLRSICKNSRLASFDMSLTAVSIDLFSDTYMDLLGRFAEASGKRGGEYFTPTPLADKLIKFSDVDGIAQSMTDDPTHVVRIGDPTAGSNTFLVKFHEAITQSAARQGLPIPEPRQFAFFAQELKNTQVGLGVFNMFYHGLAHRLNLFESEILLGRSPDQGGLIARTLGNTITEYIGKLGRQANTLDFVLANPPYGVEDYGHAYAVSARNHEHDRRWMAGVPTRSEGEWAFAMTIINLLNDKGRASVLFPLGILFRDGGHDFRKYLIENDWIDGIVSTPSNQFLTTSIPVCLLLINKNKKPEHRGGVFFINASEDFTKVGKFNDWNEEKALSAWNNRAEIPGYSGFVSTERLLKAPKCSLAVNRWFAPIREKTVLDPLLLADQVAVARDAINTRGQWLDGIHAQAGHLWQLIQDDGGKGPGRSAVPKKGDQA